MRGGCPELELDGAVIVVGPVAPAVVVVVMEDDAEAAGIVVEVVEGSGELDAGGVVEGSVWS